jgi:hypothetical protein
MNREFLVLIESEVENRDAWITKNEAKMTLPPAVDVQDLEGFLQLKDIHNVSYCSYNLADWTCTVHGIVPCKFKKFSVVET